MKTKNKICIINNTETKNGFKIAMIDWLRNHNYQVKVLPENSNYNTCEWTLTYVGKWSWDLTIYLSDAEIKAYHNGNFAGENTFHIEGGNFSANPNKYDSAKSRINMMMNELFENK